MSKIQKFPLCELFTADDNPTLESKTTISDWSHVE